MKHVFITGAGGFIGRHLVATLLEQNIAVTALMLPGELEPPQFAGQVKIVIGDVRELEKLSDQIGVFDTLFHLAAIVSDWGSKQSHIDITVKGTEQAIALALQHQAKFVVTTSVASFGSALGSGVLDETTEIGEPASSYEYVKQQQETVTLAAVNDRGLNAAIVRPANVYGVGSVWVTRYVELLNQQKPALMGKGNWDAGLVHVHNLVDGLILVAKNEAIASGEIFVMADDPGVTWQDYLSALSAHLGLPAAKSVPNVLARVLAPLLEGIGKLVKQKQAPLVTHLAYRLTGCESIYSNTKAKQTLGFNPSVTLDEAMDEIKRYYGNTLLKK